MPDQQYPQNQPPGGDPNQYGQGNPQYSGQQYPQGQSSQGGYPQGGYPQGGYPQGQNPQQGQGYGPPPKKKRKWPWIVLGVIVLLILAAALGGGGDDKPDSASGSSNSTNTEAGAAPASEPASEPASPPDNGITWPGKTNDDVGANAGDTVDQEGVVTTAAPLEEVSSVLGENLCSLVTIVNNTGENQSFGTFDWSLLDPAGTIKSSTYAADINLLESGETAPGGTATGNVCFDIPTGSPPGQYVVLFEKTFSFSSDRIGWINQR